MQESQSSDKPHVSTPQLSRRRSRSIPKKRNRQAWMRTGYFMAAALFGFLLGAGFLAIALCLEDVAVPKNGATFGLLTAGCFLSMVGGLLASKSYRETRNR